MRNSYDNVKYDAVVVGSGPNGLGAAITMAQAGRSVIVFEAKETVGGGARSAELTLPGFLHDICSAIHPLAASSPLFSRMPLDSFGLEWIYPPSAVAHPLDNGSAVLLQRSVDVTGEALGKDHEAYVRLFGPLADNWGALADEILAPLHFPRHPLLLARFGTSALRSARSLAEGLFAEEPARALFAGLAAHSFLPLEKALSAAFGLVLGVAGHSVGWPLPSGGSQSISNALSSYLSLLGGEVVTGTPVKSVRELPPARAVLLDVTPRQLVRIAGEFLPETYRRKLERYRYGPGVFKLDWALDGPIPWKAEECARAATVHVGGTFAEIATSEASIWANQPPEKPFVLVAQQSLFDYTRAPAGKHTAWGYCHVPNGCTFNMTDRIEAQIERFAPGFRDIILARHALSPQDFEDYNSNYIGGDINGGVQDLGQLFTRPTLQLNPYATPLKGIYLCSSSTPPGGGVHGMCGYHASMAALRNF
jgi:phytoene dehydrogenase-like protein